MKKIDKRITYYMTIDTETANTQGKDMRDALVYDLGLAIHDKYGKVYETRSLVIADIYCNERELMKTAYYAEKLPKYEEALRSGERQMVSIYTAKRIVYELCKEYNVKAIIAHNSRFDDNALKNTIRYATKSKTRYFLPYGIPVYDSLKMARDTIVKQKSYKTFCTKHNYLTLRGQVKTTAEVLFRYITGQHDFCEEHQGLDDVLIEVAISAKCFAQHRPMRKLLYEN